MTYLKGIYYALLGRVEIENFDCRPLSDAIDIEEFSTRVSDNYSEALTILAE